MAIRPGRLVSLPITTIAHSIAPTATCMRSIILRQRPQSHLNQVTRINAHRRRHSPAMSPQHSILSLPLPPLASRYTAQLLPDTFTPVPAALLATKDAAPSMIRRSRAVAAGAHFSYVTPLPLSFPYEFPDEGEAQPAEEVKEGMSDDEIRGVRQRQAEREMRRVENLVKPFEISPDDARKAGARTDRLSGFLPKGRRSAFFPSARLVGVSPMALKDCLPHLDVGDSLDWIAATSGKSGPETYSSGAMSTATPNAARTELSDFLSGRLIGAAIPAVSTADEEHLGVAVAAQAQLDARRAAGRTEPETFAERWERRSKELEARKTGDGLAAGYMPWANAYSGHQFGQWAGQLGDGRAVTLLETVNPQDGQRWEIQLKGAGRTPYSRFADGLATLTSSLREYLGSEAAAGLGIPTSRALALISLPDLTVQRERSNVAGICTRLAPTWVRIGSFQHHASRLEWESLRLLGEFVAKEGFGWTEGERWAERLAKECAKRNAETFALWQVTGFMHGVLNTDNISIIGLTIDFGPFAFMDKFDQSASSNKSDDSGRYIYKMQPSAGLFALGQLAEALAPIIGFEEVHSRAAKPGELINASEAELDGWRKAGEKKGDEIKAVFIEEMLRAWARGWADRLGLRDVKGDEREALLDPLFDVLEELDFTTTLRGLCGVAGELIEARKGGDATRAIDEVLSAGKWYDAAEIPEYMRASKRDKAAKWLESWLERVAAEGRDTETVVKQMLAKNPKFVLRNWVTDEVAARLEQENDTAFLARILEMCCRPFEEYGRAREGVQLDAAQLEEESRLCSVGKPLSCNMPSCSS